MSQKNKLELTWIGKDKRPRLEPRILVEDKDLPYRADAPPADDLFAAQESAAPGDDNLLIHGDNLLALKALEQQYAGSETLFPERWKKTANTNLPGVTALRSHTALAASWRGIGLENRAPTRRRSRAVAPQSGADCIPTRRGWERIAEPFVVRALAL